MKYLILSYLALNTILGFSQILHPVKWKFSLLKISSDTYQFHATATLDKSWHIYSQVQPDNAISTPTKIHFDKIELFQMIGKVKEVGKMEKYRDTKNNIGANEYDDKVDFVQVLRVKGNKAMPLTGSVSFQVCTNHQCLQPDDESFHLEIP